MVGQPDGDVQQAPLAGAPDLRDGRLDRWPGAVVLVAPAQLAVPLAAVAQLDDRVEVAVRLLRGGDDRGDLPLRLQQLRRTGRRAYSQAAASSHL